ncbi:hypothetical protein NEUTE1DRAFT_102380 [Neurospora tetrasperma FGSC 2508]|uniref:Uncharacterized protein n=1 Tax=Neurospora tetrasperma (strain FGSC 2508 / ATCC MYA-4615 / P0657) TaxID=510951 RepID=F8MPJ6_NEUT8|nr:uncharacterized protein NEUTE1DRAFT_102380 [Neurospora tetrasperma FGSC 2508]EGO57155.1 hypothetical protein NEUTE1DRAFT_102380 [Neurospora tetrasperma FGSC 2508]
MVSRVNHGRWAAVHHGSTFSGLAALKDPCLALDQPTPTHPPQPPLWAWAGGPSPRKKRGLEILGDRFGRNRQGWVLIRVCRKKRTRARTSAISR